MEENQGSNQDCEQQFQKILDAIGNHKGEKVGTRKWAEANGQLNEELNSFNFKFTLEQIKGIFNAADAAEIFLGFNFMFKLLDKCDNGLLDQHAAESLLRHLNKYKLNDDEYEFFLSKCNSEAKIVKEYQLKEATQQNKSRGILGGVGVTFGVLFGLGAIGLGTAVGIGALAVTIAAPIAAAIAVVGLALLGIFGYLTDRFRVNKVLNEIEKGKLNGEAIDEKKIPFDLRKRKEIQNALDEVNKPLLADKGIEINQ